jgi:hypothetical protein
MLAIKATMPSRLLLLLGGALLVVCDEVRNGPGARTGGGLAMI